MQQRSSNPAAATEPLLGNPHDIGLEPSRLPGWVQWVMIGIVGALVLASGVYSVLEHWRRATFALGVAMAWLAVVRLLCDSHRVGVLAVRSRRFDVGFCAVLGLTIIWMSASVDALGS